MERGSCQGQTLDQWLIMLDAPTRIACFGDSLTQGYGLRPDEALPAVLERLLREDGIRVTCLNFGISGDTSGDGVDRINEVLSAKPDAALIEFGANDCFVGDSPEVVRANMATIIETLQKNRIPILLVGITALTNMDDGYKSEFDPLFAQLADQYNIPLFPDILSCYFGNSMMTLMDGMHPNELGVEAIAKALFPQVKDLVTSHQS